MVRLPLIAAFGLLATSFGALAMSLTGYSQRTVEHLVTVPGVQQGPVSGGAGAMLTGVPSGSSPFAVYVPPATQAQAAAPAPPQAAPAAPAAPARDQPPTGPSKHHRG